MRLRSNRIDWAVLRPRFGVMIRLVASLLPLAANQYFTLERDLLWHLSEQNHQDIRGTIFALRAIKNITLGLRLASAALNLWKWSIIVPYAKNSTTISKTQKTAAYCMYAPHANPNTLLSWMPLIVARRNQLSSTPARFFALLTMVGKVKHRF